MPSASAAISRPPVGSISEDELNRLCQLIYDRMGIHLDAAKRSLVVSRLSAVIRQRNFSGFGEYYDRLQSDVSGELISELANRMTTNHTFFNREPEHFDFFEKRALPEAIQRNGATRKLRVWCAASSSGEEPYMLGMLMMEVLGVAYRSWDAGLLATDISQRVLDIARRGVYPGTAIEKIPPTLRNRYLKRQPDGDFEVIDALKREVTFRRFNLMNTRLPFKSRFDSIFIRNVMIYFDGPTRAALVDRLHSALVPGGYLFIGAAESLPSSAPVTQVAPSVFQKGGY